MSRNLYIGVTEHAKAGVHRRVDAQACWNAARWRAAMYLAGYSVECLLKVKLMRRFDCSNLRDLDEELQRRNLTTGQGGIFTHQLETLLRLADGLERLRQSLELWPLFNLVNRWIPAWRYNPDLANREDASDYLEAVDRICHWVENNL